MLFPLSGEAWEELDEQASRFFCLEGEGEEEEGGDGGEDGGGEGDGQGGKHWEWVKEFICDECSLWYVSTIGFSVNIKL